MGATGPCDGCEKDARIAELEAEVERLREDRLARMLRVAMGCLDALSDEFSYARDGLKQIDAIANEGAL
jgi:hypothetical protein